jgi:hypothetical protein
VLEQDIIYRKSGKGADALATRQAALGPRQRSLLILVDGKRSLHELAALGAALGDIPRLMEDLLAQGFIEPTLLRATGTAALTMVPAPAPRPAGAAGPTQLLVPLDKAQAFAVECLSDLLGPAGTDLCRRIEATRSPHEFRAAVRRTETTLRELVGPELAQQFVREVENLRAN